MANVELMQLEWGLDKGICSLSPGQASCFATEQVVRERLCRRLCPKTALLQSAAQVLSSGADGHLFVLSHPFHREVWVFLPAR